MVRRLTDRSSIRDRLSTDPEWALYALADLDEGLFEQCEWWGAGDALALVFHGIAIRPIFVMGDASDVRDVLRDLPAAGGYLNLRPEHEGAAEGLFEFRERHAMHRMMLGQFVARDGATVRLGPDSCREIEALYASGGGGGLAFGPAQVDTGFFRGVREDGTLIAVAGVHVASPAEGVAAVGNVFVRPDRRGRGLAQVALSATVRAVLNAGIETIGLNVARDNLAGICAYERLGFRAAFHYIEGPAHRVAPLITRG